MKRRSQEGPACPIWRKTMFGITVANAGREMRAYASGLIGKSGRISGGTHRFARFARNEAGSVMVWVAVALIPVVGMLGLATDAARGYLVKARLSMALDAAALAAAPHLQDSSKMNAEITKFFNVNFPPGFMGSTLTGPTPVVSADGQSLTLTANAMIDSTFMRLLHIDQIPVAGTTEVTRENQFMEIVVSIDMSGSMGSGIGNTTRIAGARTAAKTLVNILHGDKAFSEKLKIGLVPWNAKVNVTTGATYTGTTTQNIPSYTRTPIFNINKGAPTYHSNSKVMSKVWFANNSPVPLSRNPSSNWKGCVFARFVVTDDGIPENDADIFYSNLDSPNGDWRGWEPIRANDGEPVSGGKCELANAFGGPECSKCLQYGITPLTQTKQTMIDAINALQYPNGSTNIPQGLAWAWRVLMPAAPFTEAWTDAEVSASGGSRTRAIVLLSDGENQCWNGDAYKRVFGPAASIMCRDALSARLQLLAANVKADGVIVYVIQFGNSSGTLATLLKGVATSTGAPHYHYAPDAAALQSVFTTIANNLSTLRLSK